MATASDNPPASAMAGQNTTDLPQIASLSHGATTPLRTKGEGKKSKVVLDNDIWHMVFKELVQQTQFSISFLGEPIRPQNAELHTWFRACRLVSKDFNIIAKPLAYSFVDMSCLMTSDRLAKVSGPLFDTFLNNVRQFCTAIKLPDSLDTNMTSYITALIKSCDRLRKVHFERLQESEDDIWKMSEDRYMASLWLLSFLSSKKAPRGCEVFITPCHTVIDQWAFGFHENKPGNGCSDQTPLGPIEHLTIEFTYFMPHRYLESIDAPFPAMKRLQLSGYDWIHSAEEFPLTWDFSRLERLSLELMNMQDFFGNVPAHELIQLRMLTILQPQFAEDDNFEIDEEHASELMSQVLHRINNLESLNIRYNEWQGIFTLAVLSEVLGSLKHLDVSGDDEEEPMSLMFIRELLGLATRLTSLAVQFNPTDFDAFDILKFLAQTSTLKTLDLRLSGRNLRGVGIDYKGTDPDYDMAESLMKYMLSQRLGGPLAVSLWVRWSLPPPSWKPADGEDWCPCRVYRSEISSNGVYQPSSSMNHGQDRIGGALVTEAAASVDSTDGSPTEI